MNHNQVTILVFLAAEDSRGTEMDYIISVLCMALVMSQGKVNYALVQDIYRLSMKP